MPKSTPQQKEYHRQKYLKNREVRLKQATDYYYAKRDEILVQRVVARLQKLGVVIEKLPRKPKRCQVCGGNGRLCADHCYDTKQFRGWICNNCNSAIGFVQDDPKVLRKLVKYLEKWRT
jgi:hypothetical protein